MRRRIIRKLKILEMSGCDRPAQEPAKVVIMKRNEGSATPMSDKLAASVDDWRRSFPNFSPAEHYAWAWRGLNPAQRAQIREEESGAYQERLAQEARFRAASIRADGRGKENTTMKRDEQISILLKAVGGVLDDYELTKAEREDVLRETFDDYAERTGRDGLKDIADVPTARPTAVVLKAGDRQELALAILQGKAAVLRKARPELTESQAFAKVYTYPANAEIAAAERQASRARFAEQAASSYTGESMEKHMLVAKRDGALEALKTKAAELRKSNPSLSESQAFAKVYGDPANRALAAAERSASRAALYAV